MRYYMHPNGVVEKVPPSRKDTYEAYIGASRYNENYDTSEKKNKLAYKGKQLDLGDNQFYGQKEDS